MILTTYPKWGPILQVMPTAGGGADAAAAKLPEDQSDQLELGDVEEEKAGAFFFPAESHI